MYHNKYVSINIIMVYKINSRAYSKKHSHLSPSVLFQDCHKKLVEPMLPAISSQA